MSLRGDLARFFALLALGVVLGAATIVLVFWDLMERMR